MVLIKHNYNGSYTARMLKLKKVAYITKKLKNKRNKNLQNKNNTKDIKKKNLHKSV